MSTILVVEDELEIQKYINYSLIDEGFNVMACDNGEEALELFNKYDFDIVLLDMTLPGIGGEEVLESIRLKSEVPIIIISALNDELIQVNAFESKVDDYVVKPFSMPILIHKIKAILRRVSTIHNNLVIDDLVLEVDNYIVKYKDLELDFTSKEFEILQLLMINIGKVFSREELLTIVWGYDFYGDSRNIDVHIKNIRKKLPIEIIKTIKGVSYRIENK